VKDVITFVVLLLIVGSEALLWTRNPMHIPAGYFPARAFGLQVFQEPGASMEPAVPTGHHVLISSWAYWKSEPRIGDIVAFTYPFDSTVADLKRIVARGGSTIEIRDGVVYVDGKPSPASSSPFPSHISMPRRRVPADRYFVLGDDLEQSADSRNYGAIARDRIIGKQSF
jgi:signal peptidase I